MADRVGAPPAPLRAAYLVSCYPAVSHTFISREIRALRKLGVDVHTFSVRPTDKAELKDELRAMEFAETFTILRQAPWRILAAHVAEFARQPGQYSMTLAKSLRHRAPGIRSFTLAFAYFAEAVVLARELRRRCITHLHNHFANSGATVGFLATRLLGMPWSFTMHGISETDYPAGLMLGRKIEAADFVACVSYFGRAQAMRLVEPDQWRKLHVVRCGLPLAALPAHAQPSSVKRIISVGRLSAEKGQAGLLEAFAAVARDRGEVELVLIGDGPERELLQSRAAALDIAHKVTFAGRCGEMETIEQIARSDVLVLSSFMEGLPIVLMEAMAVGTPVIASRVAGIPELVEDGKTGLLFAPSDWDALAECIRRLLENDALRAKLARAGSVAVKRQFDVERSARAMLALFQSESAPVHG
jgi:glycosyltransferase involved in cell wall biosynthesis